MWTKLRGRLGDAFERGALRDRDRRRAASFSGTAACIVAALAALAIISAAAIPALTSPERAESTAEP